MVVRTSARGGIFDRLRRARQAIRAVRWRVAERLGRALLGGRLAGIEAGLATTGKALDALRVRLETGEARLTGLAVEVAELARRADRAVERVEAFAREHEQTATALFHHARSIRWLAERPAAPMLAPPRDGPLVSIVMAVWNRAALVGAAIESVRAQTYGNWELIVVDDGSDDDTAAVVGRYLDDGRVRLLHASHGGEGKARNRGLAESHGDIVAYLDSDNTWRPEYLAAIVEGLVAHPERDTAYAAQLVADRRTDSFFVRAEPFDRTRLAEGNYIDLNVFAHRRALVARLGGFDEELSRLGDWDLILRYTAAGDPLFVDVLGGRYVLGFADQVSMRANFSANYHRVRRKLEPPLPLRVLYALWHYPQLSESYVRAEITGLLRRGVHVEVWSETKPCAPFAPEVLIHGGALADALEAVRPTVVHVHWLSSALAYREPVARAGLPLTVRVHGFDFDPAVVRTLAGDSTVRAIFLFPHLATAVADGCEKIRAMPACFDPDRYRPAIRKDPRLVVRAAAGLPTKALETFLEVAQACPTHRFVLAVARAAGQEAYVETLVARNRALGNPVELHIDAQHEDVATLLAEAGVYLHTHGLVEPYGMPISIAEAMATGCHVIARRGVGSEAYVADAGRCYDTVAEAVAFIRDTAAWDDERWHRARSAAVENAHARFTDAVALRPLLEAWQQIARQPG